MKRVGDKPLDGLDLSPLILKQTMRWQDRMIFSTWNGAVSVRTQTHRLDSSGELFDMVTDPGQTKSIREKEPAVAAKLPQAVKQWRQEMISASRQEKPDGVAKSASALKPNAVDQRPIPVGYQEFPITMLPARDGEPRGGVQRSSNAPNCSYFVNWTSKEDSMVWLLDVHTAGRYEVTIDYTCKMADVGATVELSFQEARVAGKVGPGWDPPLYTNQDTLPRPDGESQMKDFHSMRLGEVELPSGNGALKLRALEIPGKSVMDVRRVTLTLMK